MKAIIVIVTSPFVLVGFVLQFIRIGYIVAGNLLEKFGDLLLKKANVKVVSKQEFMDYVEQYRKAHPDATESELVDAYVKELTGK